jgi:hypothetical protein
MLQIPGRFGYDLTAQKVALIEWLPQWFRCSGLCCDEAYLFFV